MDFKLMKRATARLATVALTALTFTAAESAPNSARLSYHRAEGAEQCPDEELLRSAVEERLGYPPFDPVAERSITVQIAPEGDGLLARLQMHGPDGERIGTREIASPSPTCVDLAPVLAFAISVAIDPLSALRPPDAQSPPPAAASDPEPVRPPEPQAPAASLPPAIPVQLNSSIGVIGAVGAAPALSAGITAGLQARRADFSLAVEGRADLPASAPLDRGALRTSLLLGALVPCVHRGWLAGCGVLSGGVLRADGVGLVEGRQVVTPYFSVAARAAAEHRLSHLFSIRFLIEVFAPVSRTTLTLGAEEAWATPPVGGKVGMGLAGHFQ